MEENNAAEAYQNEVGDNIFLLACCNLHCLASCQCRIASILSSRQVADHLDREVGVLLDHIDQSNLDVSTKHAVHSLPALREFQEPTGPARHNLDAMAHGATLLTSNRVSPLVESSGKPLSICPRRPSVTKLGK